MGWGGGLVKVTLSQYSKDPPLLLIAVSLRWAGGQDTELLNSCGDDVTAGLLTGEPSLRLTLSLSDEKANKKHDEQTLQTITS